MSESLVCPLCGQRGSEVVDSRTASDGLGIRRRRQCLSCHERYTTYETAMDPALFDEQRGRAKAIATSLRDMANALETW